jgi:hypothetical protein
MSLARQLEEAENMRGAELEWKGAVRAADSLPLDEYRTAMKTELLRYQAEPSYETQPGVTEKSLRHAYSEVLALPFITRIELASFYARHGAYPEAQDACEQAFSFLPDSNCIDDPRVSELQRRGQLMRQTLADNVGPEEMERLFEENFSKLDVDHNGYVHHSELERAQYDLTLSPKCQLLIRHLLCHYFDVEAAHNDEWGIDINGISVRDMKAYAARRNASWKRMSKNGQTPPKRHHPW